jgi:hypothetical protein
MRLPGLPGFAALLAGAALAAAALASADQRPVNLTYTRSGAPGTDETQGPAGAQAFNGDATTGPFATRIIPAGTAFDGTHLWVVTSPNPGVVELRPGGTAAGPFPADGPPGIPFGGIDIWVSGFNGETGPNPRATTAGPSGTGIIPAGTAFDGTHLWVVTSPNPGVIELHPGGPSPGDRVRRTPHGGGHGSHLSQATRRQHRKQPGTPPAWRLAADRRPPRAGTGWNGTELP